VKPCSHLSKASFSQNFNEQKVTEVHPLHLWSAVTFDFPVLLASASLPSDTVFFASFSSSSTGVAGYRHDGGRGGERMCFVLLSAVVKRQSFTDVLQFLHICRTNKDQLSCGGFAAQSSCERSAHLGHTGRWGQTLSDRPLSEGSLITAAEDPEPDEAVKDNKPPPSSPSSRGFTCLWQLRFVKHKQ